MSWEPRSIAMLGQILTQSVGNCCTWSDMLSVVAPSTASSDATHSGGNDRRTYDTTSGPPFVYSAFSKIESPSKTRWGTLSILLSVPDRSGVFDRSMQHHLINRRF
jgi:hypothetical protein